LHGTLHTSNIRVTHVRNPNHSLRSRIKYTIEGHDGRAKGWVFAEVSADMPSGEFVYVMVQNLQGGAVHTLVDNRSAIKAGIYGKSTGGFAALLGRGK